MVRKVRQLSVSPSESERDSLSLLEIIPAYLFNRLPDLHGYRFETSSSALITNGRPGSLVFNPVILSIKCLSLKELVMGPVRFSDIAELARMLQSLPRLQRLECRGVDFAHQSSWRNSTGIERFRNKCLCLSDVTVGSISSQPWGVPTDN